MGTRAPSLYHHFADRADIVVIDLPAAQGIVAKNPNAYAVGGKILTNELYGFAVANGDPLGLVPIINAQLAQMKSDGTVTKIAGTAVTANAWPPCSTPVRNPVPTITS